MMWVKKCAASVLFSYVIVMVATIQSQAQRQETLFHIDDKPITTDEFVYLYKKNHQHKPEEFTREKIEEYFDLYINYKLKVHEAQTRGMDTTATFKKEYETYRNELLKPYLPDAKVIDSLVELTYERLKEEVNASHILIRLGPEATPEDTLKAFQRISELRRRALAGEDFGVLAAEFSEEPGAQSTRGNLGYFTAMQMVFPFEQAAYLTPVGQVSEPVRTQFGYHIVKVLDRRPTRGEVEVSHIMIRAQDPVQSDEAKNAIFDVFDKLREGMKWEDVCAEYSDDINTKHKGGKLPPFGVGAMATAPAFRDAAFSLQEPGEISDPVQTQYGWHILRLESKIPLPSFRDLKPSLTQRVSRDERVTISRDALRKRLRREFGYVEWTSIIDQLTMHADSILDHRYAPVQHLLDSTLFSMNGSAYGVRAFLDYVQSVAPSVQPAASAGKQIIEDLLTQYADELQVRILEEQVKRESPDYKWLLNEYYEGILLFEIMEEEVWNRAMDDSTGQRAYFDTHAEKYVAGERLVGKIYHAKSRSQIQELEELIRNGESAAVKEFIGKHRIRIDSGAFEQKDRAFFSGIEWAPGLHKVERNDLHILVEAQQILAPGPQTFEEARASVISDYQSFLEDSWIRELKRKFGVKVNKKAKKRAFAQLIKQ